MIKRFNFWIFTGIFVLSVALVFCAGYYRKSVGLESGRFNIELDSDKKIFEAKTAIYDIQNEGIPKKFSQPGRISISTGHGSGVANKGEKPIWLSVKVTGIENGTRIVSTSPDFDEKTECCKKPLMPGEMLDVNVNLDFPKEVLYNYVVGKGRIEFFDYKSSKKLGEVPLKIINSKPLNSCCKVGSDSE